MSFSQSCCRAKAKLPTPVPPCPPSHFFNTRAFKFKLIDDGMWCRNSVSSGYVCHTPPTIAVSAIASLIARVPPAACSLCSTTILLLDLQPSRARDSLSSARRSLRTSFSRGWRHLAHRSRSRWRSVSREPARRSLKVKIFQIALA